MTNKQKKNICCRATTKHKVVPKNSNRPPVKSTQPTPKPTVFEQLDKLKRLLRASGIKVNANDLLKGIFNVFHLRKLTTEN